MLSVTWSPSRLPPRTIAVVPEQPSEWRRLAPHCGGRPHRRAAYLLRTPARDCPAASQVRGYESTALRRSASTCEVPGSHGSVGGSLPDPGPKPSEFTSFRFRFGIPRPDVRVEAPQCDSRAVPLPVAAAWRPHHTDPRREGAPDAGGPQTTSAQGEFKLPS